MMGRLGQKLAPLIGFCIAMLAAATLTSYVVIAQRGTATYEQQPRAGDSGPVIAQRPETITPLVLPAPQIQTGAPAPRPQPVTAPPAPVEIVPVAAAETVEQEDTDPPETFSGSLVADADGTLTDRAFGILESTTIRAGVIRPSQSDAGKKPVKDPHDSSEEDDPEEAREPDDDDVEAVDDDDDDDSDDSDDSESKGRRNGKKHAKQDDDSKHSADSGDDSGDSGDSSDSHTGSLEGNEMGGENHGAGDEDDKSPSKSKKGKGGG